jgi:hypothetical protein
MKKEQIFLQPAMPTFPIQGELGNIQMAYGFSKLEYAAIIIAGNIASTATAEILPETIAQSAIEIAEHVLMECNDKANELIPQKTQSNVITLKP